MMEDYTPEALEIAAEEVDFTWSEVLGIPAGSDVSVTCQAMRALASLYHPDNGSQSGQMVRVNAAYEQALGTTSTAGQPDR